LRQGTPTVLFDLILCRYVAFTYFAEPLQHQVLMGIMDRLAPQGYLVIGTHERLPGVEGAALIPLRGVSQIFEWTIVSEH
jgi:chemotaxis protein methyltransferase CheR